MTMHYVGDMMGARVFADKETRLVRLLHIEMPPIDFSIDHPHIQGTKLERDVRAFMDAAE